MHSLTLLLAGFLAVSFAVPAEKKIVCYYENDAAIRKPKLNFRMGDIDTSLCTHFIYRYLILEGNNVVPSDPCADLPNGGGKDGFKLFTLLRRKNPSAKYLVALGNFGQGPKFSTMASTKESRRQLIENVLAFLKAYEFDGLELDWQYPTIYGGKPEDRMNFIALLKELKERFDQEGLLLAILAAGTDYQAVQAYDIPEVSKYVDFVNLKTLQFHGSWESRTGHHANLRGKLSVESTVKYWLDQGFPKEKLVVAVAPYGRGWTLSDPKNNTVGAPASGGSPPGPYYDGGSYLTYMEICEMIGKGGWSLKFDEQAQAPYAVKGDQWIGYDDLKTVTAKAEFIRKLGLGGAMVRRITMDDFRGICGEKYPILKRLNAILRNDEVWGTGKCTQLRKIPESNSRNNFTCTAN